MTTKSSSQPIVDFAITAAETVRQLNHLTLRQDALGVPAELDQIVAEFATMAHRLPQLLRQLGGWLCAEHRAERIRSDNSTDAAPILSLATAELTQAGQAAHNLGQALNNAHQHLAHLGATQTNPPAIDRGHGQPRRALQSPG